MTAIRPLVGAIALALVSQPALSKNITVDGENKGDLDLMVKAMHVVDGKENGFDPNYGTSTLLKLKYSSPSWNGIQLGLGGYVVGDLLGLNDETLNTAEGEKAASGMFANDYTSTESILGEAYLKYRQDAFSAFAGRMIFNSPMTKSAVSTLPSFHTAFGGNYKFSDSLNVGLAQITEIAPGARTITEFGLIGEKTITAGTTFNTYGTDNQATFLDVSEVTRIGSTEADNDNGINALSLNYKPTKATNIDVWNFYADNITNTFYVEASQGYKLANKSKVKVMAQFLNQTDVGNFDTTFGREIDYNLFGVKAVYATKGWKAYAAFNKSSGDTEMLNAWSGDPAYTSSMFSRNAYREDVSAYKIGGMYKITPKWIASASYANYGQSDTPTGSLTAQNDATEINAVLTWKAAKKTVVKLTHSNRTSEYDDATSGDRTQSHTRLIGVWKF